MEPRHQLVFFVVLLALEKFCSSYGFSDCDRYTSFGYGYRDFFEYRGGNFSPNQVFYLEFYVKTSSDAHVLLKSDLSGEDGFEIVIGGGSNTFSQIRLLEEQGKKTMITQKTENFLSGTDYKQFWISIDRLGIISVGKKEDDEVFINWRFDNPTPVRYFSFGSWTNMKADWRFGCKSRRGPDVVHAEGALTPLQKLKNDLFTLYDPNALPIEKTWVLEVKINFQINYVELNERRGELTMYGTGDMKWLDWKLKWKPDDYDGIESVYVPPFQIWTPSIRVLNTFALEKAPLFDLSAAGVVVKYDGSVFWRPPFRSISSCTVDLEFWPFDSHNCSVLFGFWMEPPNLIMTVMNEYETVLEERIVSQWELLRAIPLNTNNNEDDEENYGLLYVELRRKEGTEALFFAFPYVAALVMSLTSFWVSPYSSFKLYLSCGGLMVSLLVLFVGGLSVPSMTASAPRIVRLHSWTSVLTCVPIVLFVILRNLESCLQVPASVSKVLDRRFFDRAFCLPELPQNLTDYANLNEDEHRLLKDRLNAQRLVTAIERLCFLAFLVAVKVMIDLAV